jgi:hypothetical protein
VLGREGMRRSVVGGEVVGVRWSRDEAVVPREVQCPDDDVGRVAEVDGAGATRLPKQQKGDKRSNGRGGQVNGDRVRGYRSCSRCRRKGNVGVLRVACGAE